MSVYSFKARAIGGDDVSLERYRGKVLLVVNVASQCGFTPQYAGLEALYKKHREQGFEVLAFPCNQFGGQESGNESDIQSFCETKFGVSFPLFAKVEVNGAHAHPLFTYLKKEAPGFLGSRAIKWNFTKFLIDTEGRVIRRFGSTTTPQAIESEISPLLSRPTLK